MNLRTKTFAVIGVICALFLSITYFINPLSIYFHLAIIFLFTISICTFLFLYLIRRIEHLNQEAIRAKTTHTSFKVEGHDEITSIADQINELTNLVEVSQNELESRIKHRTHELHQSNIQLQKELIEHKTFAKDLLVHKEQLTRLAHYDTLTSLPNRVFFNEMLNKTISHTKRHKTTFAILLIELDRFKILNDVIGRAKGDLVLKEIATRISTVLRSEDILARFDGDEFVILLGNLTHPKYASQVADKILNVCQEPTRLESREFQISTSIGISIYPDNGKTLEELILHADKALYEAKRNGGNHFQYYTEEMDLEAHEHVKLETALRKAITNNELVLYYQPKLSLKEDAIQSMEALLRWENPELGLINPNQFIPIAEETGLINPIGEWVIREACRTNKAWQKQGFPPISISVNLSPRQFHAQDIAAMVKSVLTETKLDPKYLELEITETTVMGDINVASERLTELKKIGVTISIDDFGVGYTSLSYLKKLPVSIIKIDRSFVKDIPENQDHATIINAIISLAHNLDMKVVAEGVESLEQLEYLSHNQCDMVQGYYLCRPLPQNKIMAILANKTLSYSTVKEQATMATKE